MLVSLFAALLCVSSYVIIPIGPVPVTLQVLFVLLAGAILGAEMGAKRCDLDHAGKLWFAGICRWKSRPDGFAWANWRISAGVCNLRLDCWQIDQ